MIIMTKKILTISENKRTEMKPTIPFSMTLFNIRMALVSFSQAISQKWPAVEGRGPYNMQRQTHTRTWWSR